LTDTTDLFGAADTADAQAEPRPAADGAATPPAAPRTRRRATSGGLAAMVLPELQALAGTLGISGVGRLRKSQLIEAIQARQGTGAAAAPAAAEAPAAEAPAAEAPAAPGEAPAAAAPAGADEAPRTTARRNGGRRASAPAAAPAPTEVVEAPAAAPQQDTADAPEGDADGDRPERVDRGRERFLEREARRQERAAAAAEGGTDAGDDGRAPRDRGPQRDDRGDRQSRDDRPQRDDRGDRPSRDDRPQRDDRPYGEDRQPRDERPQRDDRDRPYRDERPQRDDRPQRDERGEGGPRDGAPRDDDEGGARRGRFRERGRGRNRNRGDRYGGDLEPVISEDDVLVPVGGILDVLDNYGFIRTSGYLTGPNDVYVTMQQIRKHGLRRGDAVTGAVRQQREGERKDKYNALVRLDTVNGLDPEESRKRPDFTKLTPLYPQDRLRLETEPGILTTRVIDLVMPVGKGQRALIVSPPKAGKTMVMQAIANAITTNNPECHLMVVLVDERPEEVTDMQRSVKGEVIASTFDRPPQDHITVAELSIERAKRLVELGHDVVVLLDSITRLGRAYNLGAPASGRILTGGVDSAALYPPKRFLGAARNIEHGGSLTIFATALVETGSAMDTVIFEEFKGTGNAELKLDRRLADKRIFPAIDVDASGTRKEEILLAPEELRIVLQLRRVLHALDSSARLELLLDKMKATRTNVEFLMQISKTTVQDER
jgi:transcription termination factor Rho